MDRRALSRVRVCAVVMPNELESKRRRSYHRRDRSVVYPASDGSIACTALSGYTVTPQYVDSRRAPTVGEDLLRALQLRPDKAKAELSRVATQPQLRR